MKKFLAVAVVVIASLIASPALAASTDLKGQFVPLRSDSGARSQCIAAWWDSANGGVQCQMQYQRIKAVFSIYSYDEVYAVRGDTLLHREITVAVEDHFSEPFDYNWDTCAPSRTSDWFVYRVRGVAWDAGGPKVKGVAEIVVHCP